MNKVTRDYCNSGRHPKWRAWIARYTSEHVAPYGMQHTGNFCIFCGERIFTAIGSGPPERQQAARRAIFHGEIPSNNMRWPEKANAQVTGAAPTGDSQK